MCRDQVFFAGEGVVLALVLQRERRGGAAAVEAKGFLALDGRWVSPFWERLELPGWPGDGLEEALDAWRAAGGGRRLRLEGQAAEGLSLALRTPSARLALALPRPGEAGSGEGPHGPLSWRSGRADLELDGRLLRGVAAWERLVGGEPAPRFGRFELWALAPSAGGLVLGRRWLDRLEGAALVVDAGGAGAPAGFESEVLETRADPETGFALPVRWRVEGAALSRAAGQTSRGLAPGGGPAIYDIGLAVGQGVSALVFHLQDAAVSDPPG